jgi:hypothetical protein
MMTKAIHQLIAESHAIDEEALACLSPYQTEHINPLRPLYTEARSSSRVT